MSLLLPPVSPGTVESLPYGVLSLIVSKMTPPVQNVERKYRNFSLY